MPNKQKLASLLSPNRELLSWKTIFSYRNLWLFVAIVIVIIYHSPYMPLSGRLLNLIYTYGYGGVDIFLFASGVGCWFSLKKDPNILSFLKRRFLRIMPIFLMSLVIWTVYLSIVSSITPIQIIGNIFGHGTLANQGNQLNWYFACLWICYFSAPFFVALVQEKTSFLFQGLVTVLLVLFSFPFFGQWPLILWSRIPVFFLGVCAGQASTRKKGITVATFLLSLVAMVAGMLSLRLIIRYNKDMLWNCAGWWYPFILITPGFCFLLSYAAYLLEKTPMRFLLKLCAKAGEYTLSLSLIHVIVFAVYRTLLEQSIIENNSFSFFCAFFLIISSSISLEKLGQIIHKCHFR